MSRRVAIIGVSAIPVGRHQTRDDEAQQVLEHEILVKLVVEAVRDAGVSKQDVQSAVFTLPRPYTRQKYLHTLLPARFIHGPASMQRPLLSRRRRPMRWAAFQMRGWLSR